MCARCAREVAEGGLGAADGRRRRAVRRGRVSTRATPLAVVKAMARMQYVLVAHQVVGSAEPARMALGKSPRWKVSAGYSIVFLYQSFYFMI